MAAAQISVRVKPSARADRIDGVREGVLVVRVAAPPVDGRANRAVCRLIARRAGVAPSRVAIVRGAGSREKVVRVDGIERRELLAALGYAPEP